jgi:acylphosphatase
MPPRRSPMRSTQKIQRLLPISVIRRYLVSGKVQGVFFRHSTRVQAERLGLRGFVRNLADGSVEVVAQGSSASLESLSLWLQRGPELARVEVVRETELGDPAGVQVPGAFEVL